MIFYLYGFCIYLGFLFFLISIFFDKKRLKKYNFSLDTIILSSTYTISGGVLGAKIWFILFDSTEAIDLQYIFSIPSNGLSLLGGLFGGTLALIIFCYFNKYTFILFCNLISPHILFLNIFGRIGCFFSPCCNGLLYGIPLQIISAIYYSLFLFLFMIIKNILDKNNRPFFILYPFIVFFERILFDSFREDQVVILYKITKYQIISTFGLFFCLILFFILGKNKKHLN